MTSQTWLVNANMYSLFDVNYHQVFQCFVILMKTFLLLEFVL